MTRLILAEWLKVRKRRALFWWSLVLSVGIVLTVFTILEILHLANPAKHGPAGGIDALRGSKIGLISGASVAAIIIGSSVGTADVTGGVFRDLVATGRSRWQLFLARVPGSLIYFIPIVTLGYVVIAFGSVAFASGSALAGSNLAAPDAGMIARGFAWVLVATSFDLIAAMAFASLITSRAVTIGVLLGWQFIASPILEHVTFLGAIRQILYSAAIDRLDPVPNLAGRGPPVVIRSFAVAVIVLVGWMLVLLALGGWRTATRDA
jgi:hypothetical protein